MKTLLEKFMPLRDGAGDGGGGGNPAPAPAAPAPGGNQPPASPPSPGAQPPAAGQPYRPEGMPDTMYGKDDRETIDKMHTALNGYRQRDSERVVPDNVEAYGQFDMAKLGADVPDVVKAHLPELAKDPAFIAAAESFKAAGVPVSAMQPALLAAYKAMNDAGLLEAPVDAKAERAKLLPESAKASSQADQDKAIEVRLQGAEDFVKLLMKPGADGKSHLSKEVGENAMLMLMDTAAGVQFIEYVQGLATGAGIAQPQPGNGGGPSGQGEREQLRAALAAPEMDPQHPKFDRAAHDALDERYKRLFGN